MSSKQKRTAVHTRVPTRDPDSEFEGDELDSKQIIRNNEETIETKDNDASFKSEAAAYVVNQLENNTKKIMFPAFTITAILSGITVILCFFGLVPSLFGLLLILLVTISTAYIAMYGVYKWGQMNDYIDFYKQQNSLYCNSTNELKQSGVELKSEVDTMQEHVQNLQDETIELNTCIECFDELHDALKEIVQDDEEVLALIDALNKQYNDMKIMANQKDKAQLLLGYYRVQFGGQLKGKFDANDYGRFLARLNSSTRGVYEDLGGFEAMDIDKDGNVDPEEFLCVTEKVLENTEDAFIELTRAKQSGSTK